jgi:putative flippase GtrA
MLPPPRPLRFLLVGLLGIVLQMTVLVVLADGLGANLQAATVAAVAVTVAHNFAWHLRWTWMDRARGASLLVLFARFSAANGLVSLVGNTVLMTVFVDAAHLPVPLASLMAIAACGVLNYVLADMAVFRGAGPESRAGRSEPTGQLGPTG